MNDDDRQHLRKILGLLQRRLHALEERAAMLGLSTPPEVQMEIEDLRSQTADIESQLTRISPAIAQSANIISTGILGKYPWLWLIFSILGIFLLVLAAWLINHPLPVSGISQQLPVVDTATLTSSTSALNNSPPAVATISSPIVSDISNKTPLPGALIIPSIAVTNTVSVDGKCDLIGEYSNSSVQSFSDYNRVINHIYLQHDNNYLYICMQTKQGTFDERFGTIYLSTSNNMQSKASTGDFSLELHVLQNKKITRFANENHKYIDAPKILEDSWDVQQGFVADQNEVFEFRISFTSFKFGMCGQPFRIAVYHNWVTFQGDDYSWPVGFYDQPITWQLAQLVRAPCEK